MVNAISQNDISLKQLIGIVSEGKALILSAILLCPLVGGFVAWQLPKYYEASVVISTATDSSGLSDSSGVISQLGGLAPLVGIAGGVSGGKNESVAVLQSQLLTENYIRANNLLPVLFSDKWDAVKGRWKVGDKDYVPSLWGGNEKFKDIRLVTEDRDTGLITLTITWKDPVVAARWANGLVAAANVYLRDKAVEESEKHIGYLKDEAMKTDVSQLRAAIFSLMESEINKIMIANGTEEYALRVIDPAVPSEKYSSPKFIYWVFGGGAFGLSSSLFFVFFRYALRTE